MGGDIICKECTPDKCCCCIELRVGSNVIAGMNISAGLCVGFMVASGFGNNWELKWCFLTLAISSIIAGVALLHGGIKGNKITTASYLLLTVTNIVVCVVIAIYFFSGYANENWGKFWASIGSGNFWIWHGIFWLIIALVVLYLGICVFGFLMELNTEATVGAEDMSTSAEETEETESEEVTASEDGSNSYNNDLREKKLSENDDVVVTSMSRRSSLYVA